ncbi:MalY/PatB family protein [Neobacillus novalis]|uniref:cysteine-S-conjugate beta-lyase n=1 Tax=Neobacillus novalis TaxID=220687 RepID=A0AA95MSV7_9BACI|nr:MalY/PatB family protein [Neobacillus novalis]WHY85953.1 MalY/PatB family protein [Neobacillus novalis]
MKRHFDEVINRKGTYCTQWDYIEDRFGMSDLLPFSISDMDFQSPPEILKVMRERTEHGIFGYTRWNHHEYKSAITDWYKRRFDAQIAEEWIVYSPSVIYSIARLIEMVSAEGDHIVLQTPAYDAFFKCIHASNRKLIANPLSYQDGRYTIDFNDLEKKLSHEKAKVLLLCNPHNPTGRVWTEQELTKIVQLCSKYQVHIISDDIHMDVVYNDRKYVPITSVTKDLEHIYICSSASKTFNTPGLGGSYVILPDGEQREKFMTLLKNRDGVSSANIFGEISVIAGYRYAESWVDDLCTYLYNNMKLIKEFIEQEIPAIHFEIPESTYLAWLDCTGLHTTDQELQSALVEIGKVGIMSGTVYGENNRVFLRMNIGCPQAKLLDGLQRLKQSVLSLTR